MSHYRHVYEEHYGKIPTDKNGRTYEIHHIDGNHSNDELLNLKAVTIQEHYDIHYAQDDWAACLIMSSRMRLSPAEISKLAKNNNAERVANGTHHLLGGKIQHASHLKRVAAGTHHFLGDENPVYEKIKDGTHHFLGNTNPNAEGKLNKRLVENKTHHFLGPEINRKRIAENTHNFLGDTSPSQLEWTCESCNKAGKGKGNYTRYHGENCKAKS
jgi:hypothetical protein